MHTIKSLGFDYDGEMEALHGRSKALLVSQNILQLWSFFLKMEVNAQNSGG